MFKRWGEPGKLRGFLRFRSPLCGFVDNRMLFCNGNPRHPSIPETVGVNQLTRTETRRYLQPHSLYYYYFLAIQG